MSPRHLGTILGLLKTGESPRESRPALLAALESDDPDMKHRALEFSAELIDGDRMALRHVELVEDPGEETRVRVRAAEALGPVLESARDRARGGRAKGSPISAEGYRRIQRRFERFYRSAQAPKIVRRRVLEASVRSPEDWHRGAIRAAWNSADPAWRRTAVTAMGRLVGFREVLAEALEDEDPGVVCRALRATAGRDDISGVPETFIEYATAPDHPCECRLAAIEALRFVQSRRAREVLSHLTHSRDDEIAGTAAWALDEWRIYNENVEGRGPWAEEEA